MGEDDNLNASLAHIVLGCVASRGISTMSGNGFIYPGMHANFFIHSVLGFLHYQSKILDNDFKAAFLVSSKATRYLALPCLMADLYGSDHGLGVIHLVSGLIPFTIALAGKENEPLGKLIIACNIISLCHYSMERNNQWGWYTAAAGVVAYFLSAQMGTKAAYPLCLALLEYCAYRMFHHALGSAPTLR